MTTIPAENEQTFPRPTEYHYEGIWEERTRADGAQEVVFRRPLPMQLIRTYAETAVRHATVGQVDDGWLARIEGFNGVWALAPSAKQALDELEEVVFEWVLLKIKDEDRDLPILESLALNTL